MKKPGVKPKGSRALTKAEQSQRVRARLRIINEELDKVGAKPTTVHMPPVYLQALRAYEAAFQSRPHMVEVVALTSGWICRILENFIKAEAEAEPDSELANIFNSDEWVSADSLDFQLAALNAKIAIYRFEQEHEKGLNNADNN